MWLLPQVENYLYHLVQLLLFSTILFTKVLCRSRQRLMLWSIYWCILRLVMLSNMNFYLLQVLSPLIAAQELVQFLTRNSKMMSCMLLLNQFNGGMCAVGQTGQKETKTLQTLCSITKETV
uniref:Uncharacterized protein n=1 Tax=Arundo donax TaxID=35708 RepID=A0A0A9AW31_ARUDO